MNEKPFLKGMSGEQRAAELKKLSDALSRKTIAKDDLYTTEKSGYQPQPNRAE